MRLAGRMTLMLQIEGTLALVKCLSSRLGLLCLDQIAKVKIAIGSWIVTKHLGIANHLGIVRHHLVVFSDPRRAHARERSRPIPRSLLAPWLVVLTRLVAAIHEVRWKTLIMSRREGICILQSLPSLFARFLVLRLLRKFAEESHNTFLLFIWWLLIEVAKHLLLLRVFWSVMATSLGKSLVVLTLSYDCLCFLPLLVVKRIDRSLLQLLSLRNHPRHIHLNIVANIFRYWTMRNRLDLITKPHSTLPFASAHGRGLSVVVLSRVFRDTLRTSTIGIAMIVLKPIPQFLRVQVLGLRNALGVVMHCDVSHVGWVTSV